MWINEKEGDCLELVGIHKEVVEKISEIKEEAEWIKNYRLQSYEAFQRLENPDFGPPIHMDLDKIVYYKNNEKEDRMKDRWDDIDTEIVEELGSLGVLESECHLDGMGVQYESEVIYHNMIEELSKKNVIFTSIEVAMK